jgi:hypothetical protein
MPPIEDPPEEMPEDEDERPFAVGVPVTSQTSPHAEEPFSSEQAQETFSPEYPPEAGAEGALPGSDQPVEVERPRDELFVGIACALLAISVFFPWYKTVVHTSFSGWATGTWGPVVFFLALAGIAIVALRRLKVPVAFPYDHSLVLEGIGWASVVLTFFKRFGLPKVGFFATSPAWGTFAAMFAAVAVALLGGRVSSSAPFVRRPGWFKDRAGKTGAALVVVAIALGAIFGLTNSAAPSIPKANNQVLQPNVKQFTGFPPCAKAARFPQPAGVKATNGQQYDGSKGIPPYCIATMTSTLAPKTVLSRYQSALRAAKWKFTVLPVNPASKAFALQLASPQCGSVTIQPPPPGAKGELNRTTIMVVLAKCTALTQPRRT